MIIVKIWGGLCNQMFQYAFGYAQGKLKNESVLFDVDFYNKQPTYISSRTLDLCEFFEIPDFETVKRPLFIRPFQNVVISNITRRIPNFHCRLPGGMVYIKEKEHHYSNKLFYTKDADNYYDGYWQSEKYFVDYSKEIRELFKFPDSSVEKVSAWLNSLDNMNTIAIHVRRGDMSTGVNKKNNTGNKTYYETAMRYMSERIKDPVFILFSDDIKWCTEFFNGSEFPVVYQNQPWNAIDDLCGISFCKHGIMSNSTFSWWGNWLGEHKNRIVIAPKGITFNDKFIPDRWVICD